jgi:hypothetical protein
MNQPRREVVAILLDRASDIIKDEAPAAHLAARILAGSFAKEDKLYEGEFGLGDDHDLNASLDLTALTIAEYVFSACGYEKLASYVDPARESVHDFIVERAAFVAKAS